MAETDRERWNERYAREAYDFSPPDWLVRLGPRLRPTRNGSRALDLACGAGRNSLFLARLGYRVDAWDISDTALDLLAHELRGIANTLDVEPRRVDLEGFDLQPRQYDLVLNAHYLDRALFPALIETLRPGGLLLVHTFLQPPNGHFNPAHALEPGELRRVFGRLTELELGEDLQREEAFLLAQRDT
jgi:SAM-dependent methyltransferase